MVSVNILIQALEQYQTFIVIRHDQFFVKRSRKIYGYIEDFQLKEYRTYADYETWMEDRERPPKGRPAQPLTVGPSKEEKTRSAMASSPTRKKALKIGRGRAKIDTLEKELCGYEATR
jgi:ATPase subunit of ABC transporter with duplicated ATPase domains